LATLVQLHPVLHHYLLPVYYSLFICCYLSSCQLFCICIHSFCLIISHLFLFCFICFIHLFVESKKLLKGIKDLKSVRSKAQNWRNRPSPPKKVLPLPLRGLYWRRMGHRLAFQALRQLMMTWISTTCPDQN
jgi:hypothetical protein